MFLNNYYRLSPPFWCQEMQMQFVLQQGYKQMILHPVGIIKRLQLVFPRTNHLNSYLKCNNSWLYLFGPLPVVVVVVDPLLPDYWGESASVV